MNTLHFSPVCRTVHLATRFALVALVALSTSCRSAKPGPPVAGLSSGLLPSQAQVVELPGSGARGKNPGGSWQKLQLGNWLSMGASVQTAAGATLTLRLYEAGVVVMVKPDSLLRLEKLSYRMEGAERITDTILDLQKGEVAVDNSNLTPGSQFEIRAPQGTTAIPPRSRN